MLTKFLARSRRSIASIVVCAAAVLVVMAPKPAAAWWGPGWGWRGGFVVGVPPVVVGAPVYPAVPYPYYPYAPAYAYAPPYWHWVPWHRAPNGVIVAGHWEH